MKKVIAWLLVLALTATVSIGATLAYLTDTDEDVNVMTLGKVKIDQLEFERVDDETKDEDAVVQEFHDNKPLYPAIIDKDFDWAPGDTYVDWEQIGKDGYTSDIWDPSKINNEVDKMVFVKNKGDYDAYVRSVIAFEAGAYETLDEYLDKVHLNLNETEWTWEWAETPVTIGQSKYFVATATYNKVLEPGALTEISLSQIALDPSATNEDVKAFGDTFQVLVKSQAIQADGFADADTALNEGFGEIIINEGTEDDPVLEVNGENLPWTDDSPIKGIDLRRALHNLNGDTAQPITTKVTNVIYALNEEYPEIVDGYEGTLVDIEQDVPVYAYYVPSGTGTYDVYFLANDTIYSPKDSSALYKGMSALKTVDTDNYDVSRVETMKQMFRDCGKLTTLDTTGWDTSKVTDMQQTFRKCSSLQVIPGIENWDTGAVTTMKYMFRECGVSGDLDLTAWEVDNVTNMSQMFYKCPNLVNLDADGWDTGVCTDMSYMFTASSSLNSVGAAGWDTSEVTNMYAMFGNCPELVSVDAVGWDNSKVTNAFGMFLDDRKLETVTGSWNFESATTVACMFQNCHELRTVDATNWKLTNAEEAWCLFTECYKLTSVGDTTNWDLSKNKTFYGMFNYCFKLESLNTANWNTGSGTDFAFMFKGCHSLTELDVSNWDVSNAKLMNSMFSSYGDNNGAMQLKELDVSNWDVSNATALNHMFYGCGDLKELDLSNWDVRKVTTLSHFLTDCYDLERVDFSNWQTDSLTNMDCIFNNCESLKTVDLSSFDTKNVREFSQLFEACYSLEEIIGLENFNTTSGHDFSEMFSGCGKLKELNLSTFDTRNADPAYLSAGEYENWVFLRFMSGCNSLEKVTFGPYFSFDGKGDCPEGYKFVMPAATGVEGWDGNWYTADGTAYKPADVPEMTAATYYAVKPATTTTPEVTE